MDVTISLNDGAIVGEKGYLGSISLCNAFRNRGHNLQVVSPVDIHIENNTVTARKIYRSYGASGKFQLEDGKVPLSGDVFFVYGLGENNGPRTTSSFMSSLYPLENQFRKVLNSAEATSYEEKGKQNRFFMENGLPSIPTFDVKSSSDLVNLLSSYEGIIAKPNVGFMGKGVRYITDIKSAKSIEDFHNYTFQTCVHADEERRYMFLDNKLIIRRALKRPGNPGEESYGRMDLIEGYPQEEETSRKIIEKIGMFFGSVDFRGDPGKRSYLLEVNGSGTGVEYDDEKLTNCYNVSGLVVKAVGEKMSE